MTLRLLSLCLASTLPISAQTSPQAGVADPNAHAWEMFQLFRPMTKGNFCFSPFSVHRVAAMLAMIHFTSPGLTGASEYYWSVNGTLIGSGLDLIYSFPTSGEYLVCLEAFNLCDKAPQACKTIKVLPDAMYEFNTQVCFGRVFHL